MTCGGDKTIKLWNPFKGLLIKKYTGHGYDVMDVVGSIDNCQLASCSSDKSVIYWDVQSGQVCPLLISNFLLSKYFCRLFDGFVVMQQELTVLVLMKSQVLFYLDQLILLSNVGIVDQKKDILYKQWKKLKIVSRLYRLFSDIC